MYVNIKYIILSQFYSLKKYRLAKCHSTSGKRTHASVPVESGIDPVPSSCEFFFLQLQPKTMYIMHKTKSKKEINLPSSHLHYR